MVVKEWALLSLFYLDVSTYLRRRPYISKLAYPHLGLMNFTNFLDFH